MGGLRQETSHGCRNDNILDSLDLAVWRAQGLGRAPPYAELGIALAGPIRSHPYRMFINVVSSSARETRPVPTTHGQL